MEKLLASGRKVDFDELNKVIDLLSAGKILDKKYKDHALKGNLSEYRECHVKNDLLLIYCIKNNELVLFLANIGSHSEMFK